MEKEYMSLCLHVRRFSELSASEVYEILKARFSVFVTEQHIHYLDEDDIDYVSTHFALRRGDTVIAYARMFEDTDKDILIVGRMLTTERGKGYGKYVMEQIIEEAKSRGARLLRLHAQAQVAEFYEHLGFHTVGDIFIEAELPHILMELAINVQRDDVQCTKEMKK